MKLSSINESYLYHGTNSDNLYEILDSGYIDVFPPDYGTNQDEWPDGQLEERSYWTPSQATTQYFFPEEGEPVVLRTMADRRFRAERSTGDWYTTNRIPVSDLEVEKNGQWIPLTTMT